MDSGQWEVGGKHWAGSGQWTVNSGQWTVVSEQWTVGNGQRAMGTNWMEPSGIWSVRYRNCISWNFDFAKFDGFLLNFANSKSEILLNWSLLAARCLVHTVCCPLFPVHCPLSSVHYPLFTVLLSATHCPLSTAHGTVPAVHCLSAALTEYVPIKCKQKLFSTSSHLV